MRHDHEDGSETDVLDHPSEHAEHAGSEEHQNHSGHGEHHDHGDHVGQFRRLFWIMAVFAIPGGGVQRDVRRPGGLPAA
jgi:Cu2+-exporting ATPase